MTLTDGTGTLAYIVTRPIEILRLTELLTTMIRYIINVLRPSPVDEGRLFQ